MSNKLRISFEVTDNWNKMDFRSWIKYLLSLDETYDVYIISNDDSTAYITNVAKELGIDSNHTIICNFTDDKIRAISDNQINVHFDNLQSFIILVDNTTEAYGILVNSNLNRFYVKSQYIVDFDVVLKEIERINNETC